jgi:hypothetical protein
MVHGGLSPYSVRIASTGARVLQPLPEYDERAAPYRSPEQVRGEPTGLAQRRVRVWGAAVRNGILEQPAAGLMAKSPIYAAMEGVIAGCLEKDPSRRQRIQNAVIELKLAGRPLPRMAEVRNQPPRLPVEMGTAAAPARAHIAHPASALPVGARQVPRRPAYVLPKLPIHTDALQRRFRVIGAALIGVAFLCIAAVLYLHQRPAAPVLRFAVWPAEHTSYPGTPSVSPDGRFLTFSAPKASACFGCGR